jgi:4-hydroxy-tetrahydrodipicolinate synthase
MLSAPYYNKPTQEGLYQHFTSVMSKFSDKQFVIYNIPSRTGVNILPETIIRILGTCDNYFGVKEASGILEQSKTLIEAGITTFSGDDIQSPANYSLNGHGVVSVASNLAPDKVKKYRYDTSYFQEGFLESMFMETNPSPIKYYMKQAGIIKSDYVRLPLVKVSKETQETLDKFILFKKSLDLPQE